MYFSTKMISASGNLILNICDPELINKTLFDGNTKITINPDYYAERDIDEYEAKSLLQKCTSINLVGENSISLALNLGIGSKKSIRRIQGVPFLIVFKM